jgi:hypothetical protein
MNVKFIDMLHKIFLEKIWGYFSSLWKENYLFNPLKLKKIKLNFGIYIYIYPVGHSYIDKLYQCMNVDGNSVFQLTNKLSTQNVVLKTKNLKYWFSFDILHAISENNPN